MKIIYSPESLKYSQLGHPESKERVKSSYSFLKNKGYYFIEPNSALEKDILKVHSKKLFESVKNGSFSDLDCPNYKNIFYYASLSAGSAIKAMNECLDSNYSFSLSRPPGHHASKNKIGGFCYFNNIAIAVFKALELRGIKKVGIIDFDVHHGNGTQDIFLGDKRVIYLSLHQFPHYPGTGGKSERNCYNYPLPSGIEEKDYLEVLNKGIEHIKEFNPDLIAVSSGFDTYREDFLGGFNLDKKSYLKIGKIIKDLGKQIFSVLEGGYSGDLGECIYNYLTGFK